MYKRFLRCISMLLVLVMLAEMLPVTGIRSLVPKVYATDGSPESSNAVSAPVESQNTVFADIPATIIDETSQSPLTSPKLTENNQRYIDILSSYALFSQLSQVDAAFFIDFTGVTAALYTELEERGLGLAESVNYAHLISDFECSVSQALALNINKEELNARQIQLAIYKDLLSVDFTGTTEELALRGWILKGYTAEQVLNAYGAGKIFHIEVGTLLEAGAGKSMPPSLSSAESAKIRKFSDALGIEAVPIAEYTVNNHLSASDIENQQSTIEQQKAQIMISPQSSSGEDENVNVEAPYVNAPYTYQSGSQEKVALNSGALEFETEDYVLAGVNGLDLVIGRRYNAQCASLDLPHVKTAAYTRNVFYVLYGCKGFYDVPGIGIGDWSSHDQNYVSGPYATYADAQTFAKSCPTGVIRFPDYGDGADLILYYYVSIQTVTITEGYYTYSSTKPNSYLNKLYGLGQGWSFQFSSIEDVSGTKYLHLSNGSTYEVNFSGFGSHLKDYPLTDMVLDNNCTAFQNGSVTSKYRLRYQDGKCEYFSSDGKLIGIQDRFGNSIKFVHSTSNGYPKITITDTLNRTVVISGQSSANGHTMTVALPENITLTYRITHEGNLWALASSEDTVGRKTHYSYSKQVATFDSVSKVIGTTQNVYLNLTTITHPTNAQSVYTYEKAKRNLGKDGLMEVFRLSSRADQINGKEFNVKNFSYSANDCSGYPACKDPDRLPATFAYSATVSRQDGLETTVTFNQKHLQTEAAVLSATGTLQKTSYLYNVNKLPVRQTVQTYNSSTTFTSITAAEYNEKGHVTASWMPQANGNTADTEHVTRFTYDSTYGLLLTKKWKTDVNTTVELRNTLDSAKKQIIRSEVYRNGTRVSRTDYTYDTAGNVTSEKRYHDNMTAFDLIQYTYDRNAFLSGELHSGILTTDGAAALSSPGRAAGIVATAYTYDALGRMLTATDGSGNTTSYAYDALGNVIRVTNPDGTTRTYVRDYAKNTLTVTDENGAQIKYSYTPLGLEFETVDVTSGLVLHRKEYDAQSRLTHELDGVYGAETAYTYDVLDRVTSETVTNGTETLAQTLYAYNDAAEGGSYQKVTKTIVGDDAAPSMITTQYTDKAGNIAKTGKLLNGTEYCDTFTYDYVGNQLSSLTAADAAKNLPFTAKYEYNENGQVTKTYNALNQFTENTYNALGQLVQSTDYAGTPTTYQYDALGRLLSQTIVIEDGVTAATKYDYDASGNIIREWKPTNAAGAAAAWSKTEYSYNSRGKLTEVRQYDGSTLASETTYAYDAVGNLLQMTAGGSTTSYTYDRFGNVLSETDALGQVTCSTYSALGRLESTTSRNGVVTVYGYDALGRVVRTIAYKDGKQQPTLRRYTRTGQVHTEENASQKTTYTYDELGQVIRVEEAELEAGTVEAASVTVTLDAAGGEVNPSSVTVTFGDTYDLPQPTRTGCTFAGWYLGETPISNGDHVTLLADATLVAHWLEGVYSIWLDANGGTVDVDSTIFDNGSYTLPTPTRRGYTFAGWYLGNNKIQENGSIPIPPDSVLVAQWYANSYKIVYHKAENASTPLYTQTGVYDQDVVIKTYSLPISPLARAGQSVTGWRIAGSSTVLRPGSTVRNLTEEPGGVVNLYAVWSNNIIIPNPPGPGLSPISQDTTGRAVVTKELLLYAKQYTYDLAGNRTSLQVSTDSTVQNVSYTYDALNRLATVSEGGQQQAAYAYDTNGNRASLTYANGVSETYRYNKANWLTDVENKNAGGVVSSFTYTYYASGSQKSKTDQAGNVTSYTYDGLNRLTQESETGGLTHSYSYDNAGNRAQMTVSGTESYVTTYRYDAANRLLSENRSGDGSAETLYTYDADGNLLTRTATSSDGIAGATYQYDLFGQLVLSNEGGIQAAYAYNAQGIRTEKTTSAGWTQYLLDGGNVIGEQTDAELITYLRGVNLISRTAAGNTEYYLFNAHGDVTELTSNRAVVTKTYHYDAFGVETAPDPLDENPFRYCGEYFDVETGTYYLRARYYDPDIGRFTQQDTHWNTANSIYGDNPQKINEREDKLGLKTYSYAPQITAIMQSGNLYVYGVSNPVVFCDRSGHAGELALSWTGSMFWLSMIDGLLPIGDIIYLGGILATSVVDFISTIGVDNLARLISEAPNALGQVTQGGDKVNALSDSIRQYASGGSPSPGDPNWGKGFKSFSALKKYLGSPGEGNEWHHIVEQCQIKRSGFDAETIQNVNNVINISKEVHRKISAYYNSIDPSISSTMRVRDWLAGKSFEFQFQFGLEILKRFGG